jgi:hypothetical protein
MTIEKERSVEKLRCMGSLHTSLGVTPTKLGGEVKVEVDTAAGQVVDLTNLLYVL